MKVLIPSALVSYTGRSHVEAEGATLDAVLFDLERRYPGIRFRMVDEQGRIRRHIRFFLDGEMVHDLTQGMPVDAELCIVQALSGG